MPHARSMRSRSFLLTCAIGAAGLSSAAGCYRTSALHVAAERDDVEAIRRIVDVERGDANKSLLNSRTALHMAAARGNLAAATALVERGARVDAADKRGDTPLMMAANRANADMVRLFLTQKPVVDQQNRGGRTALTYAARRDSLAACEALIRAGADPTRRDEGGRTPRDYARSPAVLDALARAQTPLRPAR